jgi:homoserine O-acetyltransferase
VRARLLLVGISSDWLFPAAEVRVLAERLRGVGADCTYAELESSHGHDGFLAEPQSLARIVAPYFEDKRGRAKVLRMS